MKNAKYTNKDHTSFSVEVDQTTAIIGEDGSPTGELFQTTIIQNGIADESSPLWNKIIGLGIVVEDYVEHDKPYITLSRPAFLFMMNKLGVTETDVYSLINDMPSVTEEEIDEQSLAKLVFANQQSFERDNALLNKLVEMSPLTESQVNTAWRVAEGLKW